MEKSPLSIMELKVLNSGQYKQMELENLTKKLDSVKFFSILKREPESQALGPSTG